MRQYEVYWQTFEQSMPENGTRVVAEARHGCVTGAVSYLGRGVKKVSIIRKRSARLAIIPITSRWYLQGSERLKTKGPART